MIKRIDAGKINEMGRINRYRLLAALALVAVPVTAQNYSEGFTFLKGVRERDAPKVQEIASRPNPAVINARDPGSGEGALHILVRGRDLSWLTFLLARGARPDLQANDGTTPLILAAQIGWIDGAEQLLARGANVNLGNSRGETPLIMAVQRRDLAMVRLLRGQGANPNQSDHVAGYSALDYARQDRRAAAILRELE
ncbi:MAG TPA: ankyrin repeat domain-containing protein [Allosphingosinicella sp.]|nr:ankyrin repeat domain-containing protein [Allosphingosinicella sp.]